MGQQETDYLIVGSGLASMVFAALMVKSGKQVTLLEAHEYLGGYGHTFEMSERYKFNAQFHYVWNCGKGETVNKVLAKLGLEDSVRFNTYDPDGFDHMYMPGYKLRIPAESKQLLARLNNLFPNCATEFQGFLDEVNSVALGLAKVSFPVELSNVIRYRKSIKKIVTYRKATLQDVFDKFGLPIQAQTLLALQWPDFLLPPEKLSFFAWVMLFTGYQRGAYYPEKHFEHVIDSLKDVIEDNGGNILLEHEAQCFVLEGKRVSGADVKNLRTGEIQQMFARNVICGSDPQQAAKKIGLQQFSSKVRKKLDYEYSPSNFMAYCVVKDIDLRDYGFGEWNVFHTEQEDLNKAFHQMHELHDYSKPSFAITTPSLLTSHGGDCAAGEQVVELLTVANYHHWKRLKFSNSTEYKKAKKQVLNNMIAIIERDYVPNFRQHLVFKVTGSPTTNERYCWSEQGNSYGSNMVPENIGAGRLNHYSSLDGFYFCNASSGYAGFAGTFWTGAALYQKLSNDSVL